MDTTSVGMADSVEGAGNTPIFDELAGRFGLRLATAIVPGPAEEHATDEEPVAAG
jgi:hypothetical protein